MILITSAFAFAYAFLPFSPAPSLPCSHNHLPLEFPESRCIFSARERQLMAKRSLIIVESPSKARTIERYLGKEYRVEASNGHIKDLPRNEFAVDIADNFKAKYVTVDGKAKIIKKLKERANAADKIFLATDPDREGEAIAWHIATEVNGSGKSTRRVLFNEITPEGLKGGMAHPRDVDMNLVNAQLTRRIIDRIVGYTVSPFLGSVLYRGLSAGRVQSVALRLVCVRHEEIVKFKPQEYWTLDVELITEKQETFTARLHRIAGKKPVIPSKVDVQKIIDAVRNNEFVVSGVEKKDVRKYSPPPFTTSTLQQDAASRLRLTPRRSMRIAQRLYEGVDIGAGEPTGLITYMRTDSTRLSGSAVNSARSFISSQFGSEYVPKKPNFFTQKKKKVQDAHEAIRPTNPTLAPDSLQGKIDKTELKLYRLIWQRFMASQMTPAILAQTIIDISAGDEHLFRVAGSVEKFPGFRKVYPPVREREEVVIPKEIAKGDKVTARDFFPDQHFTEPPPYYTQSSLIRELDKQGIGRPSTFSDIIAKLYDRKYVETGSRKLIPSETGLLVNQILMENLPDIFDIGFTAQMETELDDIETGTEDYLTVLNDFYKPFRATMDAAEEKKSEIKAQFLEETDKKCEKCGSPMVIRFNRRGEKFMGCSAFPKCKNAKPLPGTEREADQPAGKDCPDCNSPLVIKKGRYGRYAGCSNYPDCRHTEPLGTDIACPKPSCEGEIVERTSRKGKLFFGCSRYPDCDYVSWNRPVLFTCQCGHHFVEERSNKTRGTYYSCPECKNSYDTIMETDES